MNAHRAQFEILLSAARHYSHKGGQLTGRYNVTYRIPVSCFLVPKKGLVNVISLLV